MRKSTTDGNHIVCDFENGVFVTILLDKHQWEMEDMLTGKYDSGLFDYDKDKQVAYILVSGSGRPDSEVISAFRDVFGAVEWVEQKRR